MLWDTPGFGDSTRVLKRLQAERSAGRLVPLARSGIDLPIGRSGAASRPCAPRATPATSFCTWSMPARSHPRLGYVDAEMQILGWIGKPVLVAAESARAAARGGARCGRCRRSGRQSRSRHYPWAETVLPFDAFARCWVQEGALLADLQRLLEPGKQPAFARLRAAWRARNLLVFGQSMRALAGQIAAAALDAEPVQSSTCAGKARAWLGAVATGS